MLALVGNVVINDGTLPAIVTYTEFAAAPINTKHYQLIRNLIADVVSAAILSNAGLHASTLTPIAKPKLALAVAFFGTSEKLLADIKK